MRPSRGGPGPRCTTATTGPSVDGKDCRTYHHKFPTKWMSTDGKEMWLLYSGLDWRTVCVLHEEGPAGGAADRGERRRSRVWPARYPGDKGIENDPAVVFAEDFEEASLDAVWSRWESVENKEHHVAVAGCPAGQRRRHDRS